MDYETGSKMLNTHQCSQCKAPLSLIWDADANDYALVCGTDHSHQGYERIVSPGQEVARGGADKVTGPGAQADLEKQLAKAEHPLSMLPAKDLGDNKAIAKQALEALVKWGLSLGLKPYLGHVCLYHGKPYVTIDGYYYKLYKNMTPIRIGTRPLSIDERSEYHVPEGAHAFLAESWLGNTRLPTTGLGVVTQEELDGKSERDPEKWRSPVAHAHPQRMAEKRAEWQVLRKLVPLEEVEL